MQEKIFKRVDNNLRSCNGGKHQWVLGEPIHIKPPLVACKHGVHSCTISQLSRWQGSTILELEVSGERLDLEDKTIVENATAIAVIGKLTQKQLWLLAADYAERVLPLFEKLYSNDNRPRLAIEAVRKFAVGIISTSAAAHAAHAAYAAHDAAYAAYAAAAAYDAAYAAHAAHAAYDAAYAAYDAAYAAAAAYDAAAAHAAYDAAAAYAERQWQGERLLSYAVGNLPKVVEPYRAYIMSGD